MNKYKERFGKTEAEEEIAEEVQLLREIRDSLAARKSD